MNNRHLFFSTNFSANKPGRKLRRAVGLLLLLLSFSSIALPALAESPGGELSATNATPPAGTVRTRITVPQSMRTGVFAQERFLNIPPNFSIAVYARVARARFMAFAPNGDMLVSQPSTGKVLLVRPNAKGDPLISEFVSDLRLPHDVVFHSIGSTTYVYISESHQISRYTYTPGDTTARNRQIVVTGLPDSTNPELKGAYGHPLKNIALDANHKLYVSIASTCNACLEDTRSDPKRGAIYQYDADGKNRRLFAEGLRNAEGLAFLPGSNDLWVVVNNRDNIRVADPASPNYKQLDPDYVDNYPAEEFTRVRDGGNYGWPFCNPNHTTPNGWDNMPFDRDMDFNEDGGVDCSKMDRISKGIQAHSAPLGLTFLQDTAFAPPYRSGVATALHGSWNRTRKTGYKIAYFPWDAQKQAPGAQLDLVSGWLDEGSQAVWGRPVDIAVDKQGALFISDDYDGVIYKLSYNLPTTPAVQVPPVVGPSPFSDTAFERLWQRTDKLVLDGNTSRSYLWGPTAFTGGLQEEYVEGVGGLRFVQYFDKSRMEINDPNGDKASPYYVTNGLLVNELISGRMQTGIGNFVERYSANIGVAGDIDDSSGPTYRALKGATGRATAATSVVISTLDRAGKVDEDAARFGGYNVRLTSYITETGHNIATPFTAYLAQSGPVLSPNGQRSEGRMFEPPFYATGLPVTEPYWARVKVGGEVKDVLVQAFERRVLTYTPSNPAGFQVEMGNVGRHYFLWRYQGGGS